MQLALPRIGTAYQSTSKQMGVLTEAWAMMNLSCPACNGYLYPQPSGTPTLDFCCSNCAEEYQLKSSKRVGNHTILGARYQTTLVKIIQRTHPSIFFLTYNPTTWRVSEALFIHRAMISEEFVVGRAPLRETARRAGYQGCTFDLTKIQPDQKLWLLKDEVPTEKQKIHQFWQKANAILQQQPLTHVWLVDILNIVLVLPKEFTLQDCYVFESFLAHKHPDNQHIRDKIRQQLQRLRDLQLIEFVQRGKYRRI